MQTEPLQVEADFVFALDSSSSVDRGDYKRLKDFVKNTARLLNVMPNKTRAGLVTYGSNSRVNFGLGSYANQTEFYRKIDEAPYIGGHKKIERAFVNSLQVFKNRLRNVPKIFLLMNAGDQPIDDKALSGISNSLKVIGVKTYLILLGMTKQHEMMTSIVGPENTYRVKRIFDLRPQLHPIVMDIIKRTGMVYKLIKLFNNS